MGPDIAPFHLPLADGTAGPPISVDLGNPGNHGAPKLFRAFMTNNPFRGSMRSEGRAALDNDSCVAL